ncbi:MAG: argininosuccinate lyase [Myxococcales bacterium]|nr:argininosuccinate lyase [Myxococcales bacterium]
MSDLLWDKGGSGAATVDERIQRFLAGDDVLLDRALFLHDLRASRAHVAGLARIGLLDEQERAALSASLAALADEYRAGTFVLDARYEDGHSAIEVYLTAKLGEVGKKVHTGRSRNDQVLVAQRLFLRDALDGIAAHCRDAANALLDRAEADALTPMPGYTHLQRAVPSSVGLWLAGFCEAFLDDADLARSTRSWIDRSPLGTAAGYGVNLPLDRAGVARDLGFAAVQLNPLYAQNSRGKFELQALMALAQALLDVRRLAWDLSLYTSAEFAFVRLPDRYTTGSSIMPQKRNPDVVELLRASYAVVEGAMAEVQSVLGLPSGYHRDLQATKAPVLRAVERGLCALVLLPDLVRSLEFDRPRMRAAITPDLFATDRAVDLARAGVPFRDAYRQVAHELASLTMASPEESLRARVSPGAPGDLRLDELRARLTALDAALTTDSAGQRT